ncbi:MAG: TonB-dependent receptor [Bacteroidota bacterium]
MKQSITIILSKRRGRFPCSLLSLLVMLLSSGMAVAQNREVSGIVTDASTGEVLLAVIIMVEGGENGTVTNDKGTYSITVPDQNSILNFSHVGYTSQSISAGSQTIININLVPEAMSIDEVMFIGYGTIKKSDLTGAVSSIKAEEFEKAAPVNVQSALQGRASGVLVSQNSGAPGREPVIRIRGTGTINEFAPIYVIDGMIMDNSDMRNQANSINFLNPADIEDIEVLKDASATAIYGSRGAHGVILITTRKGFVSSPEVNFSAQLGFAKAAPMKELLGSDEYMDYNREAYANYYETTQPDTLYELQNMLEQYAEGYDTDWLDEILKDGPALSQNYNLSLRGGSEEARYASSFGYYNEDGILIDNSSYRRYSFRINSEYKLGKIIRIGENLAITQNQSEGFDENNVAYLMFHAPGTSPLYPVLKENPDVNDPNYEYNKYEGGVGHNPVASIYRKNHLNQTLSLFGNAFVEATLFQDLKIRSSIGLNMASSYIEDFAPEYNLAPDNRNDQSIVTNSNYRTNGWLWENTITYSGAFGKNLITALAGYTSEHLKLDYLQGTKFGTPKNDEELRTLDAAISNPQVYGGYDIINMISILGRLHYSYADRYLLTASIRRDGTSKFGEENKWGDFPSAAVGWKISSESFFEELSSNLIPLLKIRAGWGQIGNSNMSEYNTTAYLSQIASSSLLRALFNEEPHQGYYYSTIGTPSLGWETVEQANIGMDLGMFQNALTVTADYFIKTTRDMLVNVYVPGYAGYGSGNEPWINAGSVENRGFEYLVSYKGNAGKFFYEIITNGTSYKNKVISTNQDSAAIWFGGIPNRTIVGYPVGSFYGYLTEGIFQTRGEVDSYIDSLGNQIQGGASPGDFRFKDVNGDGQITEKDMSIIGNPHPKFIFGLTLNLSYRGFDLMTLWQGVFGVDIWNSTLGSQGKLMGGGNVYRDRYLEAWREEGSSNTQPLVTIDNSNSNYRDSDYYVEDGSYLRMKLIQLGYSLPRNALQKLHIESCRIWIGGTNLLTLTNYSGNDPEVGLDENPLDSGFDISSYPKTRKITVGINIEF